MASHVLCLVGNHTFHFRHVRPPGVFVGLRQRSEGPVRGRSAELRRSQGPLQDDSRSRFLALRVRPGHGDRGIHRRKDLRNTGAGRAGNLGRAVRKKQGQKIYGDLRGRISHSFRRSSRGRLHPGAVHFRFDPACGQRALFRRSSYSCSR